MSNRPLDPDIDEPDPYFDGLDDLDDDFDDDWEDDEDGDDDRTVYDEDEDDWDEDDWDEDLSYPDGFDPMNQGY